uniref:Uncharacterized protein LOC111109695 n=1 Tax=Crassostrea virginica TaxID=6565 RepID=A0A8B8BFQ0_CRAVI|nr:uncharacterized protein LOC111109695 [Crassostrea virginica]
MEYLCGVFLELSWIYLKWGLIVLWIWNFVLLILCSLIDKHIISSQKGNDKQPKPRIQVFTNHDDNKFYVDEDVIITAHFENPSSVSCIIWQTETPNGDRALDTDHELSKYKIEQNSINEATLLIKGCCETDKGPYFLLASCSDDTNVKSNKVYLNIVRGPPTVKLSSDPRPQGIFQDSDGKSCLRYVTEVVIHGCVEFKASIWNFPKPWDIVWMQDGKVLQLDNEKYEGSSFDGNNPVLCIKNVRKQDKGIYTIKVKNARDEEFSEPVILEVTGVEKVLFISGPVVVSPK